MEKEASPLVYPELSYIIVGSAFDVHNELGAGHKEKVYQKALAVAFAKKSIKFSEQAYCPLIFNNQIVGKYYLDFLVENVIVVELKSGEEFLKGNISQVYSYLKANKLPLGILVNFTKTGVKFKRIVNLT